ncbi:transcription factor bHLH90 [Juglans microcarpa x Juglans regia]|uniref:transcription factor bHLH90 n=1 Tax=Juglans microcarpa x Juglans regia TaxID=2249226 RepID=UPI001B7E054A|nr:transcription factor bHLH90 [Juglans microcarpa x Juglans regia]
MEDALKGLETLVEWLRPLAQTRAWEYCVVWKLGDDPSRFIEWIGCCCSGGVDGDENVKEEPGEEHHSSPLCRDVHFEHPMRTKACQALAQLPSSMPLYSGFHGEVVISNQPRWIFSDANSSNSATSNDSFGTQVLIPVVGGLVELFATEHIPKDQKFIELITAQCTISFEQEAMGAWSYANPNLSDNHLDPVREDYLPNWPLPLHLPSLNPRIQALPPVIHSSSYPCVDRSSSGSNPSHEYPSLDLDSCQISLHGAINQSIGKSSGSKKAKYSQCSLKRRTGSIANGRNMVENDETKVIKKQEREQYHSKNLVTERNRRNRIKDGLFTLRSLVPKISKMDRTAILGDAIGYIQELEEEVKQLQDELMEMNEEDRRKNESELKISTSDQIQGSATTPLPPTQRNQGLSSSGEKKKTEVQVEVNQISQRDFLIKFFCEHKRGGFTRLMESLHLLGLQVADANITTFYGKVLNILKVEAKKDIQLKKLRSSLIELTN